jgi:hypothetical protein
MILGGACLAIAMVAQAGAQAGDGQLVGSSVLAVKGCGRERASFTATVITEPAGAWSAQDSEGQRFTGTWVPTGVNGRKLELAFDPETEAGFIAALVSDVAALCETPDPITVSSVVKKVFKLAVNRRQTRAKLLLRYSVTGSAGGRSGTARYRVKAKGSWTPAPL